MFEQPFTLESSSGALLLVRHRPAADGKARAVVLVQHGLAEHSQRYRRLTAELSALGFHVFAHDHRGHGGTRAPDGAPRLFARTEGAEKVLLDCAAVRDAATAAHPGLPVIVFGHSMGGLIALNLARRWPDLAGAAVWNADFDADWQKRLARIALRAERALKGSDVASAILARATFEAWGRAIANRRTEADWLSHDARAADAYLADPLCGWRPTVSMFEDILRLVFEGAHGLADLSPDLPLHLLGGRADPATRGGASVRRLAERVEAAGARDVTCLVVEGARHETLNEIEAYRQPAMASLTDWLVRITRSASVKTHRGGGMDPGSANRQPPLRF